MQMTTDVICEKLAHKLTSVQRNRTKYKFTQSQHNTYAKCNQTYKINSHKLIKHLKLIHIK